MSAHAHASAHVRVELVTREAAYAIATALERAVGPIGYTVAIYGSILRWSPTRDLDLYFVPHRENRNRSADAVLARLREVFPTFELVLDEQSEGRRGLVGLLYGRAIDITVLP